MFIFHITELSLDYSRWGMSRGEDVETGCKVNSVQKPSPEEEQRDGQEAGECYWTRGYIYFFKRRKAVMKRLTLQQRRGIPRCSSSLSSNRSNNGFLGFYFDHDSQCQPIMIDQEPRLEGRSQWIATIWSPHYWFSVDQAWVNNLFWKIVRNHRLGVPGWLSR